MRLTTNKKIVLLLSIAAIGFLFSHVGAQPLNVQTIEQVKLEPQKIFLPTLDTTQKIELNLTLTAPKPNGNFGDWLSASMWSIVAFLFFGLDLLFQFTPSEVDNSILNRLWRLYNLLMPNRRQGGGNF